MASKYWIKLYHEILEDPKMGMLPDNVWRRCIELFLMAGELDEDGLLPSSKEIAWRLRQPLEQTETELAHLESVGILQQVDSGWLISKFQDRQAAVSSTERSHQYRQRQRDNGEPKEDNTQSLHATKRDGRRDDSQNESGTIRPTDTDTDTDIKDSSISTRAHARDKEPQSFNGPACDVQFGEISTYLKSNGFFLASSLFNQVTSLYDEIRPPPNESKLDWFTYGIDESLKTSNHPQWRLVEKIISNIQESGSLALHQASRKQKQNGGSYANGGSKSKNQKPDPSSRLTESQLAALRKQ